MSSRITVERIKGFKGGGKFAVLTAYDYPSAKVADRAGIPMLLVGDSWGMVVAGRPNTTSVTVDEMITCCAAVARGAKNSLIVADMPFMSYRTSMRDALRNAGRFISKGNAHAVKLEGGAEIAPLIDAIVAAGIPVVGHVGLLPQHIYAYGGYHMQGKDHESADRVRQDAVAVAKAGAFAIVLELVEEDLAHKITADIPVPTIGIGSGTKTDAQVQVWHDLLGLGEFAPKHAMRMADLNDQIETAIKRYIKTVGGA